MSLLIVTRLHCHDLHEDCIACAMNVNYNGCGDKEEGVLQSYCNGFRAMTKEIY